MLFPDFDDEVLGQRIKEGIVPNTIIANTHMSD